MRPRDARVGEEDVEAPVPLDRVVNDILHGLLVGGVKLSSVNIDLRPPGGDLALVLLEMRAVEVADVDGLSAVLSKLVCRRTPDA